MWNLTELLDPHSTNGRIVVSMMRHRQPINPQIFRKTYDAHPIHSDAYYHVIVNDWWGGHYPNSYNEVFGSMESALNTTLVRSIDDTYDYYRTSVDWANQVTQDRRTYRFWINVLSRLPKQIFHINKKAIYAAYAAYQTSAWTWQFTPRRNFDTFNDTPVMNIRYIFRKHVKNVLDAK